MMLYEKYLPRTWDAFQGHERQAAAARRIIEAKGYSGGAMLITGPSGTGKTTLARIIAGQISPESCNRWMLNGDECGVKAVQDLRDRLTGAGSLFGHITVTVNECHDMSAQAVKAWLNLLDQRPRSTTFLFTTTEVPAFGAFESMMRSRMVALALAIDADLTARFARFAQIVADLEDLGGADLADYVAAVESSSHNLREMLSRVQRGDFIGREPAHV